MTHFQLELIAPQKTAFNKPVVQVDLPGSEGAFGVLAGHAPLTATLSPGVVAIYENGGAPSEKYFITGGFCEVTTDRCSVLADEIVPVKTLDRLTVLAELKAMESKTLELIPQAERDALEGRILIQRAKLAAAA